MKKLFAVLLSVLVLGLGVSFAQTDADVSEEGVSVEIAPEEGVDFDTTQFVGASFPFPIGFHYGLENVELFGASPDLRFRFSGNILTANIGLNVDALFDITQLEDNIQLYGGPGLTLGTVIPLSPSFALSGFVGGEYRFNSEFGFFAELGTGISVSNLVRPDIRGSLGVNYHF